MAGKKKNCRSCGKTNKNRSNFKVRSEPREILSAGSIVEAKDTGRKFKVVDIQALKKSS